MLATCEIQWGNPVPVRQVLFATRRYDWNPVPSTCRWRLSASAGRAGGAAHQGL